MKVGFVSLGCPKNLVDGEVMLGLVRDAGHEITRDAAGADVLVVNTCAFIDSAKQESIDAILEMAGHKRDGRCARLVVTGCLAERYRHELKRDIPEIDAVLGTGEVPEIVRTLGTPTQAPGASAAHVERRPLTFFSRAPSGPGGTDAGRAAMDRPLVVPDYLYDADTPRLLTTPAHFAYLKVAEGCDYTCAFCIIPKLRGAYRSRTVDSIVREARALAAGGVRELLLVSQDTTFFGIDRGERGALPRLLRALDTVDGLAWIRLLYLYPTTITDEVLDAIGECERVCRYIDLPLQHAAPDVLRRMRRPGNRQAYERLLARIRHRVPGVTLRTTMIVGFPGETDADFAELEGFVRDTGFDHLGVFTYSHEDGTRAHELSDSVPIAVKRNRRGRLMSLQKGIVRRKQKARVGSEIRVMIDGPSVEHDLVLQGRTEGQAPEIDPVVYLTECDPGEFRPGQLIRARVVGSRGYDLIVSPLEGGQPRDGDAPRRW
ncbi:MAG TPA: 30S ribosomal protein S12 methylthiotransferase RimO [Vicinamibacterales bacterium]|nr:30S ribosomal protein S12 methylthiotransferase RimO [Vicinamibacterales bacterium]